MASLFEMDIDEVPDFKGGEGKWYHMLMDFYKKMGYLNVTPHMVRKDNISLTLEVLDYDGGIGGYFEATVPSQTFEGVMHSVVINKKMEVVHDPNPNQLALNLSPVDIVSIDTVREGWYISDGKFVVGDWRKSDR